MTDIIKSILVHGTCLAVEGRAVLLRGAPGAGKSDLALRIIHGSRANRQDARLVSDDQVALILANGVVIASPPAAIAGQIEVRGVGIVTVDHTSEAVLALVIDLVERDKVERLPDLLPCSLRHVEYFGVEIARLDLAPFEASAPIKVLLALSRAGVD